MHLIGTEKLQLEQAWQNACSHYPKDIAQDEDTIQCIICGKYLEPDELVIRGWRTAEDDYYKDQADER